MRLNHGPPATFVEINRFWCRDDAITRERLRELYELAPVAPYDHLETRRPAEKCTAGCHRVGDPRREWLSAREAGL